jgi:PIN domain nuclease of toxin-antitoxin system
MIVAVADTHAVLWSLFDDPRLSQHARTFIQNSAQNGHQIAVSSITLIELIFLFDKQRIPREAYEKLTTLLVQANSPLTEVPVSRVICEAMLSAPRAAIPDLPDRVIAATGVYLAIPVISRDHKITASGITTIW